MNEDTRIDASKVKEVSALKATASDPLAIFRLANHAGGKLT
jgi:hypothetical protein